MERRHIQDLSTAQSLEYHWGYGYRAIPCVKDEGTCAYLAAIYWMIDQSMLYTWILWAVIAGILLTVVLLRFFQPSRQQRVSKLDSEATGHRQLQGRVYRVHRALLVSLRRWLLPESLKSIFGHVSRLQVVILACFLVYLLIFSLVGIVYRTWVTPISSHPHLHNTRTGLGGFADRVGAFAYALTPLTVALSTRESILSLITGIPYHRFSFLHRWTGRIIFVQSFLHTLGWTIVEGRLYQPQPTQFREFIAQQYAIFGVVAMLLLTFLYVFSIKRVIRLTGYEFFRKTHYVVAALYMGACWGHWDKLACWMIASIGLMFLDRGCRVLRFCLIHFGHKDSNKGFGFRAAQSTLQLFEDGDATIIRLDFKHNHNPWKPGHHFYLCFPELSIWQSHPFTPSSLPAPHPTVPHHTYIIRAEKGETRRLAELAKCAEVNGKEKTTPVIVTGPYGKGVLHAPGEVDNLLAVAGGTGISFTLPIAMAALTSAKTVDLVWVIRKTQNMEWIMPELLELKEFMHKASNLRIKIFVTRDVESAMPRRGESKELEGKEVGVTESSISLRSSSLSDVVVTQAGFEVVWLEDHHPDVHEILKDFMDQAAVSGGRCQVVASGPAGLGRDLRAAIAEKSDARKVWRGDESCDIELYWDDRMG